MLISSVKGQARPLIEFYKRINIRVILYIPLVSLYIYINFQVSRQF